MAFPWNSNRELGCDLACGMSFCVVDSDSEDSEDDRGAENSPTGISFAENEN
jgi:hypothetical protein